MAQNPVLSRLALSLSKGLLPPRWHQPRSGFRRCTDQRSVRLTIVADAKAKGLPVREFGGGKQE
jgi:hypothetical protein